MPDQDPNSAYFRIEVIKVPLAHPEQAAIVSSPRIFNDLTRAPQHGQTQEDLAAAATAKAQGAFTAVMMSGQEVVLGPRFVKSMLDSIVQARGGTGAPNATDSAALRMAFPAMPTRRGRK